MLTRAILLFACVFSIAAYADTFDVQIGAFRDPGKANISLPASFGDLRATSGPNGLTRYVVGPYYSRGEAEQARDQLRVSGFPDAFLRTAQEGSVVTTNTTTTWVESAYTESVSSSDSVSSQQIDQYDRLREGEGEVVYLDGQLHRKVGDRFVPVRD